MNNERKLKTNAITTKSVSGYLQLRGTLKQK